MKKHEKKPDFKAFIFFVDGDEEEIRKLNREEGADNIALGSFAKDHETMRLYKINPQAKTTVLLYKNKDVTAKFVDYDAERDRDELIEQIDLLVR